MSPLAPVALNPLTVAAYVAGAVLTVPALVALVRMVFFFATVSKTLTDVVNGLSDLVGEMKEYRDEKSAQMQRLEVRVARMEERLGIHHSVAEVSS